MAWKLTSPSISWIAGRTTTTTRPISASCQPRSARSVSGEVSENQSTMFPRKEKSETSITEIDAVSTAMARSSGQTGLAKNHMKANKPPRGGSFSSRSGNASTILSKIENICEAFLLGPPRQSPGCGTGRENAARCMRVVVPI